MKWQIKGAETVFITPGIGKVAITDSITINPPTSVKYKLTATSYFGAESTEYIKLVVHPLPEIQEFKIEHSKIKPGKSTTLKWQCKNFTRLELSDGITIKDVTHINHLKVSPQGNTVYQLKVIGQASLKEKIETVGIQVLQDTKIGEFKANRLYTIQTVPTVLRWKVKNAEKLLIEPGGIDVTGKLSIEVFPNSSTTYELIAKHELHESRKSIRIDVTPIPRLENFKISQPPIIQLKPPSRIWPLLPELLSGITSPEDLDKILIEQIIPGKAPYTGSISRMLSHVRKLITKSKF